MDKYLKPKSAVYEESESLKKDGDHFSKSSLLSEHLAFVINGFQCFSNNPNYKICFAFGRFLGYPAN